MNMPLLVIMLARVYWQLLNMPRVCRVKFDTFSTYQQNNNIIKQLILKGAPTPLNLSAIEILCPKLTTSTTSQDTEKGQYSRNTHR